MLTYWRDRWTGFDAQYIIRRSSAQGRLRKFKFNIYFIFFRDIPNNYNVAYGENLKKI